MQKVPHKKLHLPYPIPHCEYGIDYIIITIRDVSNPADVINLLPIQRTHRLFIAEMHLRSPKG